MKSAPVPLSVPRDQPVQSTNVKINGKCFENDTFQPQKEVTDEKWSQNIIILDPSHDPSSSMFVAIKGALLAKLATYPLGAWGFLATTTAMVLKGIGPDLFIGTSYWYHESDGATHWIPDNTKLPFSQLIPL